MKKYYSTTTGFQFDSLYDIEYYGRQNGLYGESYLRENKLDIYFLKLAKMMKDIGRIRIAGRMYMQSLFYSIQNDCKNKLNGNVVATTKPEKIYRILVHFYTDLGSFNYLKKIKKNYDTWYDLLRREMEFYYLECDYNKGTEIYTKIDEALNISDIVRSDSSHLSIFALYHSYEEYNDRVWE